MACLSVRVVNSNAVVRDFLRMLDKARKEVRDARMKAMTKTPKKAAAPAFFPRILMSSYIVVASILRCIF
jgi:hypothetical protein